MKNIGLLVIAAIVTFGYAQAPDTLWTKTYGGVGDDYANSILLTGDGGYIFVGTTYSFGAGEGDVWIVKTDSLGYTLWTKTYGDSGSAYANSIQPTTDGGYIIAGGMEDSVWILKIDGSGDTLWTRRYKPWTRECVGHDVKQTSDGGYIVSGELPQNHPQGFNVAILIKTNSVGDTIWTTFRYEGSGNSVVQTLDGGYIVAGEVEMWEYCPAIFLKTDSVGNHLWCQVYYTDPVYNNSAKCILEKADSGFIACGSLYEDICLFRLDSHGDTLWTTCFDNNNNHYDTGYCLSKTLDGGYIIVGNSSFWWDYPDAVIFKTDSLGSIQWSAVFGDSLSDCCLRSVRQTSDNGYVAVGYTNATDAGSFDIWLVKFSPDVGVVEEDKISIESPFSVTTIFRGSLQLPEGKTCKVFDITGRIVEPNRITCGVYFIEIDGVVTQKVVKVR